MYHPDIRMVPSGDPVQVVCIRDLGTFDGDFQVQYECNLSRKNIKNNKPIYTLIF